MTIASTFTAPPRRISACVGSQVVKQPAVAGFDDLAGVHEHVEITDLAGESQFVGDDHHRHAQTGELAHHGQHVADELGIECRGGLVEEHHLGVHAQGPRDRHALLLPTGHLAGIVGGVAEQPDALERQRGLFLGIASLHPTHRAQWQRNVLERRDVTEQVELLADQPDDPPELQRAPAGNGRTWPRPYSTPSTCTSRGPVPRAG